MEIQPAELVTVNVYVPAARPLIVVDAELPDVVTPPGLRVSVQVPDGKPFNTTEPVASEQDGCVMLTEGAAGVILGALVPLPATLVHPFTVVVTVYTPALLTVIELVEAPLLQRSVPVAVVVSVEVPLQLFTTVTSGVAGIDFGAAMPDPGSLVHPFKVVATVYVPAVLTLIELVEAPVLHKSDPAAFVERVEVPLQLSTTVTNGVSGIDFGAAMPDPGSLLQPLMVVVTV